MRKSASAWIPTSKKFQIQYPSVDSLPEKHYDAIVVGGGVFGCTTAYKLKQEGLKVALIEARAIGSGTGAYSTAKATALHGVIYSKVIEKQGQEGARKYYDLNMRGIALLEELVTNLNLDCDFDKREHIVWTSVADNAARIQHEHETCSSLGIPCKLLQPFDLKKELPVSIDPVLGISFENQAIFNPYKFCQEIVKHIQGDGSDVFEQSRVTDIKESGPIRVSIEEHNVTFTADKVVVATHLPILDRSFHFTFLEPSKSHCIAARVKGPDQSNKKSAAPGDNYENLSGHNIHNMFINIDDPMRSMRPSYDGTFIVVCGEPIKQGDETETQYHYNNLISWAGQHFYVEEILGQWSAMDYYSPDFFPYIGYLVGMTDNIFTGTGFSKWGLAAGITGGEIIADMVQRRENPFTTSVNARRFELNKQIHGYIQEGIHTGKHFVKDKFMSLVTTKHISSLRPDQGGLVKVGIKTVGAYRDPEGTYHTVHPVCTHLGCSLLFNSGDKLWDCPCHGSQFDVDGKVIHGPAVRDLTRLTDLEW
jgi:glycine/D-amino acid oxidase-like deaminating enzyme/nitrite reductase/ring-hydroxylating ferredoxin subunit